MKNRGFTLIELLAVIVVLGALALLTIVSVNMTIDSSEIKLNNIQVKAVKEAAKIYYLNEKADNSDTCVNVSYLVDNDYIEEVELFATEDSESLGSVKITYNSKKYSYEYQESECSVDNPIDYVCKNISGNKNEIGSKYQCKVKDDMEEGFEDGYYFFVLSHNDDGTTNLIMDRNIYYDKTNDVGVVATASNANVAWYSSFDHSYGPVIAMTYLHNATKDWDNIPNMIMNYEDENINHNTQQKGTSGYGSIVTTGIATIITSKTNVETGRIENLKARMPRYDEVHGEGKCLTYSENGNKYGSCPLWLSNYLQKSDYVTGEELQNINNILGYWTLCSSGLNSRSAWYVSYFNYVSTNEVQSSSSYGVRPVITLSL